MPLLILPQRKLLLKILQLLLVFLPIPERGQLLLEMELLPLFRGRRVLLLSAVRQSRLPLSLLLPGTVSFLGPNQCLLLLLLLLHLI